MQARRNGIGLIHEVVAVDAMEAKLAGVLDAVFLGSPTAIAATKSSFLGANNLLLDERQIAMLAHEGWTQRASPEGIEGTAAFREKRKPSWLTSRFTPTCSQYQRGDLILSGMPNSQSTNAKPAAAHPQGEVLTAPPRRTAKPPGPCSMVIFGAGGDLTKRLLVPALYNLATTGLLPEHFELIGVDLADLDADKLARQPAQDDGELRRKGRQRKPDRQGRRGHLEASYRATSPTSRATLTTMGCTRS